MHALVNCAGVISENVPAEQAREDDLDRPLARVNVKGSLWTAQAGVRQHALQRRAIVNLASQTAIVSLPHQVVYTATRERWPR